MIRLFVALLIPDDIKKTIFEHREKAFPGTYNQKWEPADKIHVTLKFIGEVSDELIDPIAGTLDFIKDYKSFDCELTGFGFFYKGKDAKILWMGLKIENKVFDLVEKLNNLLKEFSIPVEKRKFKPHLTLKRLKGNEGAKFIRSFEEYKIPAVKFKAGAVALYKSELLQSGSVYKKIKIYNLK